MENVVRKENTKLDLEKIYVKLLLVMLFFMKERHLLKMV